MNRVIALLLSITLLWGYGLYLERQNLLIQRENDYRRSFQELACHLAGLEDGLARIQAARSKEQRMLLLLGISHDAAKAQGKLSQLPLTALSSRGRKSSSGRWGIRNGVGLRFSRRQGRRCKLDFAQPLAKDPLHQRGDG